MISQYLPVTVASILNDLFEDTPMEEVKVLSAGEAHSIAFKMREKPDPKAIEEFEYIMERIGVACNSGQTSIEERFSLSGYTDSKLQALGYKITPYYTGDQVDIRGYNNIKYTRGSVWTIINW